MRTLSWIALLALVLPAASSEPDAESFATIGPALVQGNFHQYPPFYSTVIAPHAVVAEGTVFCAFQDTQGKPVVMAYRDDERTWAGPVYASEFGLGKDPHGNPSICLDREGHIHIFYGCHGGPMRHARSREPYGIEAWDELEPPTRRATYPQSMLLADGRIALFYRAGGHMEPWTCLESADDGATWSGATKVVEMRLAPPDRLAAAYASFLPGHDGKTIHAFWVHKDDNAARVRGDAEHPWRPLKYPGLHEAVYRYNMYYLRRDAEGVWQTASGKTAALPVSKAFADEHCLVFDSGDEFTSIGRPMVDAEDRPYVRFNYGVGDWKKGGRTALPWSKRYARYADGQWHVADRIPDDWPKAVRKLAVASGPSAWGPGGSDWTIYFESDRFNPEAATSLFLEHTSGRFAKLAEGPVKLP